MTEPLPSPQVPFSSPSLCWNKPGTPRQKSLRLCQVKIKAALVSLILRKGSATAETPSKFKSLQKGLIASQFLNICDGNKHASSPMKRYPKLSVADPLYPSYMELKPIPTFSPLPRISSFLSPLNCQLLISPFALSPSWKLTILDLLNLGSLPSITPLGKWDLFFTEGCQRPTDLLGW